MSNPKDPEAAEPDQTTNVPAVDLPRLVRLVVAETVSRAEQACRYALKHQDFSGESTNYRSGWEVGAEVCKGAIADHVERHIEDIIVNALHSLPNTKARDRSEGELPPKSQDT